MAKRTGVFLGGYVAPEVKYALEVQAARQGRSLSHLYELLLAQDVFGEAIPAEIEERLSKMAAGDIEPGQFSPPTSRRQGVFVGAYIHPGLKAALQEQARTSYRTASQEIRRILDAAVPHQTPPAHIAARITRKRPAKERKGFVYLFRAQSMYKIGHSNDPAQRLQALKTGLPCAIECVHIIPCEDAYSAELALHGLYAQKRVQGEWFALSDEDVRHISGMTSL